MYVVGLRCNGSLSCRTTKLKTLEQDNKTLKRTNSDLRKEADGERKERDKLHEELRAQVRTDSHIWRLLSIWLTYNCVLCTCTHTICWLVGLEVWPERVSAWLAFFKPMKMLHVVTIYMYMLYMYMLLVTMYMYVESFAAIFIS